MPSLMRDTSPPSLGVILTTVLLLSLGACDGDAPLQPEASVLDAPPVVAENAMAATVERTGVHWLSDLSVVEGGAAQLVRTGSAVSASLRTTGLQKGDVVTIWWVIFNHPDACENPLEAIGSACSRPDLANPDVQPSVMWATGNVVGGSGASSFAAHLKEGEITAYHPLFVGSPGLVDVTGAEIHLVVRPHGPLIPELAVEMRTTFAGGCTPETSFGFGDGPNACSDAQAAAFPAP